MPTITSLTPQQRNKDRLNVFLDDEFAFGVSLSVATSYMLSVGKDLSEETIASLEKDIEKDDRYQKVLNYLSFRPRSVFEIESYIRKKNKGVSADEVTEIVERLKKLRYLDDAEFAQWWVRQRREMGKKWGPKKIKLELFTKKIDASLIDVALSSSYGRLDDADILAKEAEKLLGKIKEEDPYKKKQKLMQRLARRGFEWSDIRNAVDIVLNKE